MRLQAELSGGAISAGRLVVGGFSQGGALSLHTALSWGRDEPPAGVLCMSGYLPLPSKRDCVRWLRWPGLCCSVLCCWHGIP